VRSRVQRVVSGPCSHPPWTPDRPGEISSATTWTFDERTRYKVLPDRTAPRPTCAIAVDREVNEAFPAG